MSWALIIGGAILFAIGLIMIIIGIVLYEQNVSKNPPVSQPWYVWLLLIGGVILALIGGALFAWGMISRSSTTTTTTVYTKAEPKCEKTYVPPPPINTCI